MVKNEEPTDLPPVFIRERMKYPRITGEVLAERMGTTPPTVSRLLNGKRKMTLEWLYAFAKALDTPISALFSPPEHVGRVSGEVAISKLLEQIDFIPEGEGHRAYRVLVSVFGDASERSSQTQDRDQSSPATRHRSTTP